jgi:hypothetical protein
MVMWKCRQATFFRQRRLNASDQNALGSPIAEYMEWGCQGKRKIEEVKLGNKIASLKKPTASLGQPVILRSVSPRVSSEKSEIK